MGTNKFKHDLPLEIVSGLRINRCLIFSMLINHARYEKRRTKFAFSVFGGVDGTRTRDPRRDRPVF